MGYFSYDKLTLESQIMKKIIVIIPLFLFCSAWASEKCEDESRAYVEIREDYKSLAELRAELRVASARAGGLTGEQYAIETGRIRMLDLQGQMVFNHMGGAKGDKLYKRAYAECVAEEKAIADRIARQEAREEAKAAKGRVWK